MGNIKITYLLSLLLALTMGIAITLLFKTKGLQQDLEEERAIHKGYSEQTALHQQLLDIDSLLVDGDYQQALQAYHQYSVELGENGNAQLGLRIEVAKKMNDMRRQIVADSFQKVEENYYSVFLNLDFQTFL